MKRVAVLAMFIAAIVAAACVSHDNSGSSTTSENTSNQNRQATVATTVATPTPPALTGYVTDTANVIDKSSRNQLEATLTALKRRDKIDFAVVTVGSTGKQSARNYSLVLAHERTHQIKDENNAGGLLLLVAVEDHNWHIQVSRNLEDELTNEVLTKISAPMTDSFRQKAYAEGIIKYVSAVISKLAELHSSGKIKPFKTSGLGTLVDPAFAFTDAKSLAEGVAGGRGTRNTPTILNAVFSEFLFWYGRARSLEDQSSSRS